jgi:hypothetical protein
MRSSLSLLKASGLVLLASALSCSSSGDTEPKLATSHQDLCAGAPPEYEDHGERIATAIACPFVQHTENIATYGERLPDGSAIYDHDGALVANVTHACDGWTLGTDAQGITVVIDRVRGAVLSHGTLHAGQELTSVHSPMSLPAQVHPRGAP